MSTTQTLILEYLHRVRGATRTKAKMSAISQAMRRQELATKKTSSALTVFNAKLFAMNKRLANIRWAMVNIGFVVGGVVAAGWAMSKAFDFVADLQFDLERLSMVTGQSTEQLKTLIDKTIDGYGISREEGVKAYTEIAKAGYNATESANILSGALSASILGFSDLESSTNVLIQTMKQFNIETSETGHVVSALVTAANLGKVNIEDIGQALKYAGASANILEIDLDELLIAISRLSNAGLTLSQVGTGMRAMFTEIIDPSTKAQRIMKGFGLDLKEAARQDDIVGIITEINTGLGHLSDPAKKDVLAQIFEKRSLTAIINMLEQIHDLADFEADVAAAGRSAKSDFYDAFIKETGKMQKAELVADLKRDLQDILGGAGGGFSDIFTDLFSVQPGQTPLVNIYDVLGMDYRGKHEVEMFSEINEFLESDALGRLIKEGKLTRENLEEMLPVVTKSKDMWSKFKDMVLEESDALRESAQATEEAADAQERYNGIISAKERAEILLPGSLELIKNANDLASKWVGTWIEAEKQIKNAADAQAIYNDMLENFLIKETEGDAALSQLTGNIIDRWEKTNMVVNTAEGSYKRLRETAQLSLQVQKDLLADYKEELSGINTEIGKLSSARFTGQTGMDRMINKFELYLKKQSLADRGVTDAQQFLQEMLVKSAGGFDNLVDSINSVNDATNTGKDSYEAWRETISEFIREAVASGNELEQNVSGAVNKYSTLLMSTSKFGTEQDKQSAAVSLMRDAYDVHYGAMRDDVNFAVQTHEDASNGVYSSSQVVIGALQSQWSEQSRVTMAIEDTKNAMVPYNEALKAAEKIMNDYNGIVVSTADKIWNMAEGLKQAAKEQEKYNNIVPKKEGVKYGGGMSKLPPPPTLEETGYPTGLGNTYAPVPEKPFWKKYLGLDDFISRPGQDPVSFSPQDTIVGFKGDSMPGGNITIGNINISGMNTDDPGAWAAEFSRELRREMRNR